MIRDIKQHMYFFSKKQHELLKRSGEVSVIGLQKRDE
jgi:hypothetical protein